jgi:hypothetical protein
LTRLPAYASPTSAVRGGQVKLAGHLREQSALHLGERHKVRADAESLGEVQPEPIQESRLLEIRSHHAAEAELAPIGRGEDHIGALDAVQFRRDRPGALPQPRPPLPQYMGRWC